MDERSGMGSVPRGPGFAPWDAAAPAGRPPAPPAPAGPQPSPPAPYRLPPRPPLDPLPTLLTVLAVLLVGAVVVVASVLSDRTQARPTAGRVVAPASVVPVAPHRTDRVEFVSADGDGVLVVTAHRWTSAGDRPPLSGSYLEVEVELRCSTGFLLYGPSNFSAFDAVGELFETASGGPGGTPLGHGSLTVGQSVRGTIAFDLPRGEVTLLLSDSSSRSVTALKIPD